MQAVVGRLLAMQPRLRRFPKKLRQCLSASCAFAIHAAFVLWLTIISHTAGNQFSNVETDHWRIPSQATMTVVLVPAAPASEVNFQIGQNGMAKDEVATSKDELSVKPKEKPLVRPAPTVDPEVKNAIEQSAPEQDVRDWLDKAKLKIVSNTVYQVSSAEREDNKATDFQVQLRGDGTVIDIRLVNSSGNTEFDDAVRDAILASQPYPAGQAHAPLEFRETIYPVDVDFVQRHAASQHAEPSSAQEQ